MSADNIVQAINAELDNASLCVSVWNDTTQRLLYGIQSVEAQQASDQLSDISERLRHQTGVCTTLLDQVESELDGGIAHQVCLHCALLPVVHGSVDSYISCVLNELSG